MNEQSDTFSEVPVEGNMEIPIESVALIPRDGQVLLQRIYDLIQVKSDAAEVLMIEDDAGDKAASSELSIVRRSVKELDAKRKTITDEWEAKKQTAWAPFRDLIQQLQDLDKTLEKKILQYRKLKEEREKAAAEEERRKQIEELEKQAKEQEEQAELNESEHALDDAIATHEEIERVKHAEVQTSKQTQHTTFGSTGTTKRWTYKVTDITKVPREYLEVVDEVDGIDKLGSGHKKLQQAVNNGLRELPGIEIFQKAGLTVR